MVNQLNLPPALAERFPTWVACWDRHLLEMRLEFDDFFKKVGYGFGHFPQGVAEIGFVGSFGHFLVALLRFLSGGGGESGWRPCLFPAERSLDTDLVAIILLNSMESPSQIEFTGFSGLGVKEPLCLPSQFQNFPRFRYMGSKFRLLDWLHCTLDGLEFESAVDAFSGSGVVSYLLKSMGSQVHSNDSLAFPAVLSAATVANNATFLTAADVEILLSARACLKSETFIQRTFEGIFYTLDDLKFLDNIWSGLRQMNSPSKQAIAIAALLRSCIKRQPRGLFTVAGDPERYKDGRRDLSLSLREHFVEQVEIYNAAVFSNGKRNRSTCGDVLAIPQGADLVYMDPPYVPRSDDNCYVKRYHFLEGLACYWDGKEIMQTSKVKKIIKPFTPFSYRRTALEAFDQLFRHFADSSQVLSYSSNAYPGLDALTQLMGRYKKNVDVLTKDHRYHFGTHQGAKRNQVEEYLIIGTS
jgi:DNA adenine methylase/adenine-specific DNA-methyltransferase